MVRTRIAPSPTGFLHIGTARTALFNYLFARRHGGQFIMRTEDTDKERSKAEFEKDIIEGLHWLGITWDEGPDCGGNYGPYRQSERTDTYKKYLQELAGNDFLYPCFCTQEELEQEKELQTLAKQPPRYGGKCRNLSLAQREQMIKEGRASTLRFKIPQEVVTIHDLIRGDITFDTSTLDDIIIAKNIETPLFNFAVIVDDYLMKITHVIRGEDHISNTPKQILIARALGFEIPQFGHMPLILNADRTKLSKRQNKVSLLEYKKDGYLPEALINFMVLLGWSGENDQEFFSLTELEHAFSLDRVHKAGAVFNLAKLDWFNAHYIRAASLAQFTEWCIPFFIEGGLLVEKAGEKDTFVNVQTRSVLTRAALEQMVALEQQRMRKLSDAVYALSYFFCDVPSYEASLLRWKDMTPDDVRTSLSFVHDILKGIPEAEFTAPVIEATLKRSLAEAGKKNGEIFWPFRVSLTGRDVSPSPFDVAAVLGKEQTVRRITYATEL